MAAARTATAEPDSPGYPADSGGMPVHILHVPSVHCAGCISKIETHMSALPGVAAARVNLSRKELRLTVGKGVAIDDLTAAMERIGFPAEELDPRQMSADDGRQADAMLKKLAVAGFGMMNVMLLSVSVWSGADATTRQFLHLVSAMISLPILAYSSQPFLISAFRALRAARLNMDVPISLAIVLAALMSLHESLTGGDHAYFDAALSLTFFLLAGRYLDLKARQKARSAAAQLARMQTPVAFRRKGGDIVEVAVSALGPGMTVVVRPGERIPADGVVAKGRSDADRSFLTGEAMPASLGPGSEAFAGEICLNGTLDVAVSKAASDSVLSRFIDLVDVAERGRHRYSDLADRAAAVYAPLVHLLAAVAFAFWLWASGDIHHSLTIAIAVLIITCPCALGLAVPAVMTSASGQLFSSGVLLKNATALERCAGVDTVVFDKTGTLTNGRFRADGLKEWDKTELALLRELAGASQHPLAKAVSEALPRPRGGAVKPESITEVPGCGMTAKYQGRTVKLGKPDWLAGNMGAAAGNHRLGFRFGNSPVRWLDFTEELRPDTGEMLKRLDGRGMRRILLTGDNTEAAGNMAERLGFSEWHGGVTPERKLALVEHLRDEGACVLMVGDGLNDTGAMAAADASVAPSSALDAARTTADFVLLAGQAGGNLAALPDLIDASRGARWRILQNFGAAALYNMIAVPLALAGLATPLMAAIAMSASSITVVLNSVRPGLAFRRVLSGAGK